MVLSLGNGGDKYCPQTLPGFSRNPLPLQFPAAGTFNAIKNEKYDKWETRRGIFPETPLSGGSHLPSVPAFPDPARSTQEHNAS